MVLISYSFGIFLPFIHTDLQLSPLEAGLLQSAWWVTSAGLALPCSVATWTAIVTFLPTLLLEQHGMPPGQSGPLLGCLYYGLIWWSGLSRSSAARCR